jgi:hypothetical protein
MFEIKVMIRMITEIEKYLKFDRSKASRSIDRYMDGAILYRYFNDDPLIDDLCYDWS